MLQCNLGHGRLLWYLTSVLWCYSAIWGMEGYYDTTLKEREARKLQLCIAEHSVTTSLQADGTELIEMPLSYDKYTLYMSHSTCSPLQCVISCSQSLCRFIQLVMSVLHCTLCRHQMPFPCVSAVSTALCHWCVSCVIRSASFIFSPVHSVTLSSPPTDSIWAMMFVWR